MINIRKLVAVDMLLHGTRFIVAEFALGIIIPLILGLVSIRAGLFGPVQVGWETALGVWLISIALNYIPLFLYAVLMAKGRTAQAESQPELAFVKRYGAHQVVILIPLLVVILALMQAAG